MRKAVNLPGWEKEFPVRAEIERCWGWRKNDKLRVVLENDARVAALGEQWWGAARGVDNMAVLTLGSWVGGGIVLGGKTGMHSRMAGEFGDDHEPEGHACGCGNRGCAEQYASANRSHGPRGLASGQCHRWLRPRHRMPGSGAKSTTTWVARL